MSSNEADDSLNLVTRTKPILTPKRVCISFRYYNSCMRLKNEWSGVMDISFFKKSFPMINGSFIIDCTEDNEIDSPPPFSGKTRVINLLEFISNSTTPGLLQIG